jgi:hypothetical protein
MNQIYAVGGGPSEYESLMDFCIDTIQRRVILLCARPYQIMEFSYSGEFIKSNKINGLYFNIAVDSKYIYCSQPNHYQMDGSDKHALVCMDRNYNIIEKYLPSSGEDIKLNHVYEGNNLTSAFSVCYTRQFDNTIYFLKDGKLMPDYSINFGKYTLPVNLLKNGESGISEITGGKQYAYAVNEVSDSPDYLIFNTNTGIFVLDKKNNTVEGYETIYDSKLRIGRNNYLSVGYTQMLALQISPSVILNMNERLKTDTADPDHIALFELAGKVKIDDNPVLILYELK